MNRIEKLEKLITLANEKEIWNKNITVYGYQFNYQTLVRPSLSKYWFSENKVEEWICPKDNESGNHNRPGTKKESIEYVTVHDTASSKDTADEYAHAKYVANGGGGTSWHYSVGSNASCHQIPDDEVAYHAGDSLDVRFVLTKTAVLGTNPFPKVEIVDGYYYLDGKNTTLLAPVVTFEYNKENELVYASDKVKQKKLAPSNAKAGNANIHLTTNHINDAGIRIDLKEDGYYYMGPTYYNATYQKIANRGGNLNSIGIESMVNQGSNLMRTWHRLAKLVANLLVENHLDTTRVKPHHFFSGKPCPMTLRENGLWDYFMECVKVEYQILKEFPDAIIECICQNDVVASDGCFNQDVTLKEGKIAYQVRITLDGQTRTIPMESMIK